MANPSSSEAVAWQPRTWLRTTFENKVCLNLGYIYVAGLFFRRGQLNNGPFWFVLACKAMVDICSSNDISFYTFLSLSFC